MMHRELFGNELWRWVAAASIAAATIFVFHVVRALLRRRASKAASHTRTRIDDVVVDVLEHTTAFFYVTIGLYLGSRILAMPDNIRTWTAVLATLMLLLQLGVWGQQIIRLSINAWRRKHESHPSQGTMAAGIAFLVQLAMWTILLLMALSNMGIEITALIAGLGMGGIAAALAVQSLLGDLFASLSIYFDRPFDIGDYIVVGELQGTVEKIGMRSTRLKSLSGEQLIFSNKDLVDSRIRNFKRMNERRIESNLGIEYGTTAAGLEQAVRIVREVLESTDGVRADRVHFKGFGESSLDLQYVYFVLSPDYTRFMDIQQHINLEIMRRFEAHDLEFAFPTRTVRLEQEAPLRVRSDEGEERAPNGDGRAAPH